MWNVIATAGAGLVCGVCVCLLALAAGAAFWLLRYIPRLIEEFLADRRRSTCDTVAEPVEPEQHEPDAPPAETSPGTEQASAAAA